MFCYELVGLILFMPLRCVCVMPVYHVAWQCFKLLCILALLHHLLCDDHQ